MWVIISYLQCFDTVGYYYYYYYYIHLMVFFSRTTWVCWHQKGKPFWILLEQEIMGWQWHQLDHLQLAPDRQPCQYLTTQFLQVRCPSCRPINSVKALFVGRHQNLLQLSPRILSWTTWPTLEQHRHTVSNELCLLL